MSIIPATIKHIRRVDHILDRQWRYDMARQQFRTTYDAIRAFFVEEDPEKGLACVTCGAYTHLEDTCGAQPCLTCGVKSCYGECRAQLMQLDDYRETVEHDLRIANRFNDRDSIKETVEETLEHYHRLFDHTGPAGECWLCAATGTMIRKCA